VLHVVSCVLFCYVAMCCVPFFFVFFCLLLCCLLLCCVVLCCMLCTLTFLFVGGFQNGDVAWFIGGKLNVSYNCIDRHAATHPDKVKKNAFFKVYKCAFFRKTLVFFFSPWKNGKCFSICTHVKHRFFFILLHKKPNFSNENQNSDCYYMGGR